MGVCNHSSRSDDLRSIKYALVSPMNYIKPDQIEWKKVKYLKNPIEATDEQAFWDYELLLNEPLASWDVFSYWERERIESMRSNLKKGDILFDIGSEQGWCNLVYAAMVSPENMVLIEPTPEFWPNIKALWEKNYPKVMPLACYSGFFADKSDKKQKIPHNKHWPFDSDGDLIDRNSYRYVNEHKDIQKITIDDYVSLTGIIPDALTMDTEGAELLILRGAEKTLRKYKPKVWVSEHLDLQDKNFGIKEQEIADYMKKLGYQREFLARDHEEHIYYHA